MTFSFSAGWLLLPLALPMGLLSACSPADDKSTSAAIHQQMSELKTQSDQLAAEIASLQVRIKDLGSADVSGPAVLAQVLDAAEQAKAESARLASVEEGLQTAIKKLSEDKEAFSKQYGKAAP